MKIKCEYCNTEFEFTQEEVNKKRTQTVKYGRNEGHFPHKERHNVMVLYVTCKACAKDIELRELEDLGVIEEIPLNNAFK